MAFHRNQVLSALFAVLFIVSTHSNVLCSSKSTSLWVVYKADDSAFHIVSSKPTDFIAVATFDNAINETGWAKLDITTTSGTNSQYSDSQQVYAAGFVEGHITRPLMKMHWANTLAGYCPEPLSKKCREMKVFLEDNIQWLKDQIKLDMEYTVVSPFWYHVQLYLTQMAGLQDGYNDYAGWLNTNIDVLGVYMWQVSGDLEDLTQIFQKKTNGHFQLADDPSLRSGSGRCSALLRLLPGNKELYVAQDTWNDLPSMLRILKRYNFELHRATDQALIPGNTMTFSSYPGMLMSGDDFYTISSGLVTQETTIGNSNPDLLTYISSKSVLEGFRSMVANRLAKTGREWAQIFEMFNSGTYNNQWMVVDYNRFEPSQKEPLPGIFYLVEQIPGTVKYADMTNWLYKHSYYGSYNIAFFPEIFNKSGQPAAVEKYGDWFTYDKSPRALIFKRDAVKVTDLDSMTRLMRYNNFRHDPLSRCNCTPPYSAENAISCRDDLNPANGTYAFGALGHRPHVGTDMKLTSYSLSRSLSFLAISGPTSDDLPPFRWSTSDYQHLPHHGHPDLWDFPRIMFNGSNPISRS